MVALVDAAVVWRPQRNAAGHVVDFIYEDVNDSACAAQDLTREELVGHRVTEVLSHEMATALIDTARMVLDDGTPLMLRDFAHTPSVVQSPDVRFDIRVVPVDGVIGFTWRVSGPRQVAAVALAESERRYRLLAENATDIVYQTGSNGCFTWISPSIERVLGWKPEELLGTSALDLVVESDRDAAATTRDAVYSGAVLSGYECRFMTADGGTRWMAARGRATSDADGIPNGTIVGLRDVEAEATMRQQLRASEARFRLLAEHSSDIVLLVTDEGVIEWASPTANHEVVVGNNGWDLVHPDDRATADRLLHEAAASGEIRGPVNLRVLDIDRYVWMSATGHGISAPGVRSQAVVALRNVDAQVREHEQLEQSESRYRLLVENATDAVAHSRGGEILWVSPGVADMLGWQPADWVGRRVDDYVHPDDLHLVLDARTHLDASPPATLRFRMRAQDGRYHWVETHVRPYVDQHGKVDGVAVSFRVVDSEVAAERELERRARYDELTGLLNRKEALDRLEQLRGRAFQVGHEVAILFCDLDRFKDINDRYGHAAGDELLRVTAGRLRSNTRQCDLVARLGGDELLVVLDGVHDLDEAKRVAEKLRRHVAEPIAFGDQRLAATVSVGVTVARPGEHVDVVIARADAALYEAKHSGRDQVIAFPTR
jgi:diguanylate cyclase (GGDEF)-like protein/PAS domain S-box-containing protein